MNSRQALYLLSYSPNPMSCFLTIQNFVLKYLRDVRVKISSINLLLSPTTALQQNTVPHLKLFQVKTRKSSQVIHKLIFWYKKIIRLMFIHPETTQRHCFNWDNLQSGDRGWQFQARYGYITTLSQKNPLWTQMSCHVLHTYPPIQ